MVSVHLGPSWFFGADACLEALASVIAFFVALASFRVYRLTKERKYGYFTVSMVLLTLSFLSRAVTDALMEEILFKVPARLVGSIFYAGYVAHILLALVAYLLLFMITHKLADKRVIALLFLILIPSLLLSGSYYMSFYGISALLLGFIALAYWQNYRKVCKLAACLVFASFSLLTVAQLLFLLEAHLKLFYVAAELTQAAGYLLLLFALIKTMFK
ncbi:MAG: hypothetical protein NTW67_04445 [Candidatus Woesearchaeota archaeon]|nr:hypothetical protein [Candidatus Woesearchaeota archaeon]